MSTGTARAIPPPTRLREPATLRQRPFFVETILALVLIAVPLVLPYLGSAPNTVNRILVWGLFGIGFDILFGYTGLLSFGQSALYGTGGFVAAYLLTRAGFPYVILALVIGTIAAKVPTTSAPSTFDVRLLVSR